MNYFHNTLLSFGFNQVREGFYTRPLSPQAGGPLYCSTQENDRPRKLLLWQPQRMLLQGDIVTLQALEQVLRRVLGPEEAAQAPGPPA